MANLKMLVSLIVVVTSVITADGASLQLYCSSGEYTKTPLSSPESLLKSSYFKKDAPIIIYAHGYNGSAFGDISNEITKSYIKDSKINFMTLDWSEEASPGSEDFATAYQSKAVPHSKKFGDILGEAIIKMIRCGVKPEQFHLIGHSLGAQLVGYAGKKARKDGKCIPRITGLNPYGLAFNKKFVPMQGLGESSADLVVCVNSGPVPDGKSSCHVNISLNCDKAVQPGCSNKFGETDTCSHIRAPLVYAEAVASPKRFPAIQADSCQDWEKKKDAKGSIIYMSGKIDPKTRGDFYLKTNSKKPYGMGDKGLRSKN